MSNHYPWVGTGKKLTDYDIPRIGHMIGVDEDTVRAVLDVESRGTGFDKYGVIKLFESHIFLRQLPESKRAEAIAQGLGHKSWAEAKRAGNYKNNHARFLRAYELDKRAALEATSFGLAQIMGFNHRAAGYESAWDMVVSFADSESNQLAGMINFIKNNKLDDELRAKDWAGFARGYNGSGYKANSYDTRLAKAYAFWQRKPDVQWTPTSAAGEEMEHSQTYRPPKPMAQTPAAAVAVGAASMAATAGAPIPLWAQLMIGAAIVIAAAWFVHRKFAVEDEE
jgi:hypothetical protein